ncbi:MAG: hypothetical protein WBD36_03725 [Bacteroidota bacterium]
MTIAQAFSTGIAKVNGSKRFITFVWIVNVLVAGILAVPMLNQLDNYIRDSGKEQSLRRSIDDNWFQAYQYDFQKSEIARTLDYSIFGYAPFMHHMDGVLSGSVLRRIGGVFSDLLFGFRLNFSQFTLLTWLALLYALVNTFFAGGFIGAYAAEWPSTLSEFLVEGAKYFGRFFRLSLISLLLYYLFFIWFVDWANNGIPRWTQNEPSEMTPYLFYMARNAIVLIVLALMMMGFDYAKIRMVLDGRYSALGATGAGFRFAFRNFLRTFGLYLLLCLLGIGLILVYSFLNSLVPQTGYWTILLVFVLQQIYVFFRIWLKASFYATQTAFCQKTAYEQFTTAMKATQAAS